MTNFPDTFTDQPIELTAGMGQVADEALKILADRDYKVLVGLNKELAKDIIAMSREPHIREYCPNDCLPRRFESLASTQHWLSSGRAVFTLVKKTPNYDWQSVGYGWVGDKTSPKVPGGETTFALRIGKKGLGQKLSAPFSRAIIAGSIKLYGAKNVWLETWQSNQAAAHVYGQIGFKLVAKKPSHRQTASGSTVEDTRLFMSLPDDLLS